MLLTLGLDCLVFLIKESESALTLVQALVIFINQPSPKMTNSLHKIMFK